MNADALARAVAAKVEALQAQLLAKVEANLSGDVLQTRSGALRDSISGAVEMSGAIVTAKIASIGVAYAAIHEAGGDTAPHEIVAVKARALRLASGGFASRVRHPGSRIPARRFMAGALDDLRGDIRGGLKDIVRAALGA